ncbi:MAG: V-type ATP synthase subunit E [Candidatus Bathyarchaeia archaeon]
MTVKEGLSAIANEVLADAQKEANAIVLNAENDAKEALRKAKQQADKNAQTILTKAASRAEAEKRRIASVTEIDMRNILLQAKEDLVDAAFEKVLVKLKEFAASQKYQRYLLKSIQQATQGLSQESLVLKVNAKDKAWLTQELDRLSKKLSCELRLSDEKCDIIGGFKAQTADGKLTFDGTIDNRLNELKPQLRMELAKIMFKEEK